MFVVCERWVGDGDRLLHIDPSYSNHSSTSFASSWLGLLNRGSLRAQIPLSAVGSHFGILSPTDSNHSGHLVISLSYVLLLLLFFRLFTLVHLLIDGSVKGQYITIYVLSTRWNIYIYIYITILTPHRMRAYHLSSAKGVIKIWPWNFLINPKTNLRSQEKYKSRRLKEYFGQV